jgi:putative acetyltransferase
MTIRTANIKDIDQIRRLFFDTVTNVNAKYYTRQQILVWSASYNKISFWRDCIESQFFFVGENSTLITGFASITKGGLIDLLYIHKDFQRMGVATKILAQLERLAYSQSITKTRADVSLTAMPFFLKRGYSADKTYKKKIDNIEFVNTIMSKEVM